MLNRPTGEIVFEVLEGLFDTDERQLQLPRPGSALPAIKFQWPLGARPPSLTLRRLSASGTAASANSISTQKASI